MSELYECLIEEEREDLVERIQKKYVLGFEWHINSNDSVCGHERFAAAFSDENDLLNYVEDQIKRCEEFLETYQNSGLHKHGYTLTVYADYHNIDCIELSESENNLSRMLFCSAIFPENKNVCVRFCTEDLENLETLCRKYAVSDMVEDSGYLTYKKCRRVPFS